MEENKKLEGYQKRVITEKEALDSKIEALTAFLTGDSQTYKNLIKDEKADMKTQLSAMTIYSQALGRRIERFPAPAEPTKTEE